MPPFLQLIHIAQKELFSRNNIIVQFLTISIVFSTKKPLVALALKLVQMVLSSSLRFVQFNHTVNHITIRLYGGAAIIADAIIFCRPAPNQ